MPTQRQHGGSRRARLACTACNARRVKCNVVKSRPCRNCIAANVLCETRESQCGKHPRKSQLDQDLADASRSPLNANTLRNQKGLKASHALASLSASHQDIAQQLLPNQSPEIVAAQTNAMFSWESTSLRYFTDESASTIPSYKRAHLRHSVPSSARADSLIPQWESERRRTRMKNLHEDGAFTLSPTPIREKLLKAYFRWFHPHFPIVDEPEIWSDHKSDSLSPLLLQAMLFIGVIHCEESILVELGWGNRHRAKYQLYSRAKDIYDAEYETKKLIVVQALFLMSFWRASALLEKDVPHWLGAVISLAQTKAFHRSGSENENHSTKLRRHLWWAIYARERQCSSVFGLPNRIQDDDCDVEMLSEADFELAFDLSTPPTSVGGYKAYTIDAGYLPDRTMSTADRSRIRGSLEHWKEHLGSSIQLSSYPDSSFQAIMLHVAYNNLQILLQPQVHVITNLFNTLCIHVAHLRRSNGITQTIAENRAKLCLLGLQELQRTWEVANWVLQHFFQYLDRTTAARLAMGADDVGIMSTAPNAQSLNAHGASTVPARGEPQVLETNGVTVTNSLAPSGELNNAATP
ncbi:hypothetical protein P171DRAFT_457825 [Karstenula rhodostoma CBS 690.94]|uniref:Zn(2)-C6 fungal-type domain-containing protein n=1 Tax=Karstenula rhodostoma CBS 690.94 TaxID=1392251 RepID=A0A9P4PBF4_9PLEO|nr:hypothetical protein P171DRAFT_457825 [Karstenula rhodostoma CBS 690.94]